MMSDIVTIVWKEWKEFLLQRGSLRGAMTNLLLMVVVFGVFLPLQAGRAWLESPMTMAAWAWLPLFLVTGMIADSFAGERERHTLETLLASRLADSVILLGKVAAGIGYALVMTAILLVTAAMTVNVASWDGKFAFYPVQTLTGALVIGVLGAGLVAGLGVLVSLRAATVRQAAQSLSIGILVLVWVPILAIQMVPREAQQRGLSSLMAMNPRLVVPLVMVGLAVLDVLILALARARFQRARLILD